MVYSGIQGISTASCHLAKPWVRLLLIFCQTSLAALQGHNLVLGNSFLGHFTFNATNLSDQTISIRQMIFESNSTR